jgi:hypothetical protein
MLCPRLSNFALTAPQLISLLVSLGLLSILYLRRQMYEIFLKLHLTLALALMGTLWIHVGWTRTRSIICISISSGLWLGHHIVWLVRLAYRNFGLGQAGKITLQWSPESVQVKRLSITLKRPWKIVPGQYIYITIPGIGRHYAGFLQAHPYSIAWVSPHEAGSKVVLLVQSCDGFSSTLFAKQGKGLTVVDGPNGRKENCEEFGSVLVDGPYGGMQALVNFDKVLFIASGIGIAAHLLSLSHLLQGHNDQTARVRRLTLVWFLETEGIYLRDTSISMLTMMIDQETWADEFLHELLDMDSRKILMVFIYVPNIERGSGAGSLRSGLRRTQAHFDVLRFVEREWDSEAGNMAISSNTHPLLLFSCWYYLTVVQSVVPLYSRTKYERRFAIVS